MKIRGLSFFIVLFSALLLVGCGSTEKADSDADKAAGKETKEDKSADEKLGDYTVHLGGTVTEDGDVFVIEGESNLLPGARVVGEIWLEDDEREPFANSTEIVQDDGSFQMEIDHHEYGEAEIIVKFDLNGVQDDEIKRHYGEKGQKLEGPFIYRHKEFDGIFQKAEARIDYDPGEKTELVFKAPDWNEIPDDYGDPRVWIEIDEITEDGEFFYISGRSNILEGSELKVEYRYNRDKTQVMPDGSFTFKFDYEYLEDRDIVITFDPAGFQWNEIEEAYGKNGQKLVGDLVQQNRYNQDKQFVEKRIPWDEEERERDKAKEKENDKDGKDDEEDEKEDEE